MVIGEGRKEEYERDLKQELEFARYIRDIIQKSDDTRALWRMVKEVAQVAEARVLQDMGEGRYPNGNPFYEKDFWLHVGEVQGIRLVINRITSAMAKAEKEEGQKE